MIMSSSGARAETGEAVEILWDGKPFDAGGESVTICHWGGEMQDMAYDGIIKQFEADYNCRVVYDAAYPWFPKMSTAGPDNPPIDLYGGNLPESLNLEAQGYFVSHADLKANVPAVNDMVEEIAFYGPGVIWGLHVMGLAYRTDTVVPPPTSLADLFDKTYENTRAIYVPINDLQAILFMSIAQTFGADQYDKQAALDKLQEGMPWITSPFTGETMNLMERGEVVLAWQTDGEALLQKERGLPINWVQAKERRALQRHAQGGFQGLVADEEEARLRPPRPLLLAGSRDDVVGSALLPPGQPEGGDGAEDGRTRLHRHVVRPHLALPAGLEVVHREPAGNHRRDQHHPRRLTRYPLRGFGRGATSESDR